MSDIREWKVLRRHEGDRLYEEGEVRKGTEQELGHLSPRTLELFDKSTRRKAEAPLLNKAEGAPANKAETGRKAK
ncbi:hypothetical protein [Rhizobium sp. G21]|uniref:hypothetical protein n=1 Tax=Rhizobium sp. G21 TaxID=2758439 RepID=UPI0016045A88|nr:hypothetical protein [Rhizobium sp. G21]MBB1247451.1 hypothetical protein [Rhizobium sp. G21]